MRPPLLKNKKGDFTGGLYMIVMLTSLAIFILIVGYIALEITPKLKDQIDSDRVEINQSFDATMNTARNTLSAVWFIVFLGLLLGILITSWNIPSNPIFVPIFVILLVITVIVGSVLSGAYEEIYEVTEFASISASQSAVYFVMSNLEYTALIIGLISLIVTFAKPGGGTGGGEVPYM